MGENHTECILESRGVSEFSSFGVGLIQDFAKHIEICCAQLWNTLATPISRNHNFTFNHHHGLSFDNSQAGHV